MPPILPQHSHWARNHLLHVDRSVASHLHLQVGRRIVRISPIALEVLYGLQHEVPDAKPDDDEADEYYVPGEYDENSDDDDGGGNRGGDDDIDPPKSLSISTQMTMKTRPSYSTLPVQNMMVRSYE